MRSEPALHPVWPALILAAASLLALGSVACADSAATSLTATPNTGRGPFFPVDADAPADNDLRSGASGAAQGVPLRIEGRVVDRTGEPVPGVEIVLWQVDAGGNYNHPGERRGRPPGDRQIDPNFQYWGKATSGEDGSFWFETIVPAHYRAGGQLRPNHVHFEFRHPGFRTLATEMNFRGDPHLEGDFVTQGIAEDQLETLQVDLEPLDSGEEGAQLARWTVVLD